MQPRENPLFEQKRPKMLQVDKMDFQPYTKRRQPTTVIDASGKKNRRLIPDDLSAGAQTTIVTRCQAPLSAIIAKVIEQHGCTRLRLATWAASGEDIQNVHNLLKSGTIEKIQLIVDPVFSRNAPEAAKIIADGFGVDSFLICKNHAKFAIIESDKGRVMIRTSMNLDATPGLEYCTFDAGGIADYVAERFDAIYSRKIQPREFNLSAGGDKDERRRRAGAEAVAKMVGYEDAYTLSAGKYDFIDVIESLARTHDAREIAASFWIASIPHIDRLAAIPAKTRVLCDKGMRQIKGGERLKRLHETIGADAVKMQMTHLKYAIIDERAIIMTSANLNGNPRSEHFRISENADLIAGMKNLFSPNFE